MPEAAWVLRWLLGLVLKASGVKIGKWAHDCACRYKKWEGKLVGKVYLDGYHGAKHKCKCKSIKHSPSRNSHACGQLWSRLDHLASTIAHFSKSHYRFFWHMYGIWRNKYARSAFYVSDTPLVSRRQLKKHGK